MTDRLTEIKECLALGELIYYDNVARTDLEWAVAYIARLEALVRVEKAEWGLSESEIDAEMAKLKTDGAS